MVAACLTSWDSHSTDTGHHTICGRPGQLKGTRWVWANRSGSQHEAEMRFCAHKPFSVWAFWYIWNGFGRQANSLTDTKGHAFGQRNRACAWGCSGDGCGPCHSEAGLPSSYSQVVAWVFVHVQPLLSCWHTDSDGSWRNLRKRGSVKRQASFWAHNYFHLPPCFTSPHIHTKQSTN